MEFKGKDLAEAIAAAAAALSLPAENLKFTVLSMGSKGFLGLGRRKAVISINPEEAVNRLEADSKNKASEPPVKKGPPPNKKDFKKEKPPTSPKAVSNNYEKPIKTEESGGLKRPRAVKTPPKPPKTASKPMVLTWSHVSPPITRAGAGETVFEGPPDQVMQNCERVVNDILSLLNINGQFVTIKIDGRVIVSIESPDSALLIGRRGAALESLQLLVNKIINKRPAELQENNEFIDTRVVLDVADYRFRRWEYLLDHLKKTAENVLRTGKPQTMTGLAAPERRMVHMALKPIKGLSTHSSGAGGSMRDLVIAVYRPRRERAN